MEWEIPRKISPLPTKQMATRMQPREPQNAVHVYSLPDTYEFSSQVKTDKLNWDSIVE